MSTADDSRVASGTSAGEREDVLEPAAEADRVLVRTGDAGAASEPAARKPAAGSPVAGSSADIADGTVRRLDPRSITLGLLQGAITSAILSAGLLIAATLVSAAFGFRGAVFPTAMASWLLLTLALTWLFLRWPAVAHRHASYKVDAEGIEIRRGVVWRTVVNVPRSRVQHTDVAQGPLERKYGLGRLIIFTAGSAHAQVPLHGLDYATALRIRDVLLPGEGGDAL